MTSPPITVVGAGVFGLAAAFAMARRGARVTVIEARHVGAGSSGGHVGALAPHVPENWNEKKALQLASLLAARDFWAEVAAISGRDPGYARLGRLQPVPDAATADRLAHRIDQARLRWPEDCGMSLTDRPESALVPDSPTGLWLHDALTARLSPRAACAALAGALRALGARIIEGQHADPDLIEGPALWACGTPGLLRLNEDLGRKVGQGVKGQSALLAFAAPDSPQVFADGLHIVPHADGTTAIGSTSENNYDHDRPDDQVLTLIQRARAICPALRDAPVIETWAGLRPRAQSRAPILAPWPGRPGHLIANGGFKIGFGMAPLIADLAARALLEGDTDLPPLFALP
ncbi:FAD-binding oxidoreductase [Paracoccus bogoriensis]|uniref:NAD(P)/FAD-dependent oxidoreductase n=1 Tax=Paracoccus bogoriensis TaxID=242065 RepID=UPI001C66A7D4|nr:FAD-binding oxidoreductase [Paracoccus bogoriensis]MBW7055237.1 FAD-binding oxidoreductase [Paracoccus bogoriensis]